jgi:hypothetical protein
VHRTRSATQAYGWYSKATAVLALAGSAAYCNQAQNKLAYITLEATASVWADIGACSADRSVDEHMPHVWYLLVRQGKGYLHRSKNTR